jgi:hypothetical protein
MTIPMNFVVNSADRLEFLAPGVRIIGRDRRSKNKILNVFCLFMTKKGFWVVVLQFQE